jgi:4-alpha-glucanotransferase
MLAGANPSLTERRSGVLAHLSSIPSSRPDEPLIERVERFLDWCQLAGFRLWQVLPLNPVGLGNSPYSATSAFAGRRWTEHAAIEEGSDWNPPWLDDWALYAALKRHHKGAPWTSWDLELRRREPAALESARRQLAAEIRQEGALQAQIHHEALQIRRAAAERDIVWLGDLPFYVALDSADVWAHRELFKVDEGGQPSVVAGCPPDDYSEDGQRWNHPVFNWPAMQADQFRWWIGRLDRALEWVDALRVDHFRGYSAYWEIDAEAPTAAAGRWVQAPGKQLFDTLFDSKRSASRRSAPLIAEDLGVIDNDVETLRDRYGFAGMHVLQFGWGDPNSTHDPSNHRRNALCCTGTHDNDTTLGWLRTLEPAARRALERQLQLEGEEALAAEAARQTLASPTAWAVLPLQDLLELGSEARMNLPGTAEGQWGWRAAPNSLTPELAAHWRALNLSERRLP